MDQNNKVKAIRDEKVVMVMDPITNSDLKDEKATISGTINIKRKTKNLLFDNHCNKAINDILILDIMLALL